MNNRLLGAFFIVLIFLLATSIQSAAQDVAKTAIQAPRFEISNCAVPIPEGVRAECGNLYVKEDRSKADSRTIKLPIIIVKSGSNSPAPDPVFYTGGGPGGSSLGRVRGARNLVPFTRDRDFIIFEQRGTLFADPNLQCPEVNNAIHSAWEQSLTAKKAKAAEVRAAKACRDRLVKQGIDLSQYDSAASAADMEDLRRVLGIGKWNLYGVSYSTRLMMNYIREYGANVRSVILDSVLPPSVNYDETSTENVLRSLDMLFAACERDAFCAGSYPDLKKTLYSVIAAANKKPIVVTVAISGKSHAVKLDGNAVFDFVYNLLESTGVLSDIPWMISEIEKGNYDPLKPWVENNLTSDGFIWGARYSVWCREEMPFQDRRKIAAQARFQGIKGFQIQGALPGICKVWNVPAADRVENQPVKSDIPALILGGEFDPDTPTAWGRMAASWFKNGFYFEAGGASHGVLFSSRCANVEIVPAFLKDPYQRPEATCLEKTPLNFK